MIKENFEIVCKDGIKLKGMLLIPDNPKAVIQFNCGTGSKKKKFINPSFLTWLQMDTYAVCGIIEEAEIHQQINLRKAVLLFLITA